MHNVLPLFTPTIVPLVTVTIYDISILSLAFEGGQICLNFNLTKTHKTVLYVLLVCMFSFPTDPDECNHTNYCTAQPGGKCINLFEYYTCQYPDQFTVSNASYNSGLCKTGTHFHPLLLS